jgi:hypothetical protein
VDLKVKFDYATTYQIRLMVERFFPFTRSSVGAPSLSSPSSSPSSPSSSPSSPHSLPMDVDVKDVQGPPHPFTQAIMDGIGEKVVSTAQLQDWFIKNLRYCVFLRFFLLLFLFKFIFVRFLI